MSWYDKVIWSEGMFLQPQHFQQHDRYFSRFIEGRIAPLSGYFWGFSRMELDSDALSLGRVQLLEASGIFPDGTPFNFPVQDKPPLPIEIDPDIKDEPILLALPMNQPGADEVNFKPDQHDSHARYALDEMEIADSNTQANNNAFLQVGQLRLKFLCQRDLTDAYTVLGVVEVSERRSDNQLVLNKEYIPPMLSACVNGVLARYLQELYGLLHQRGEMLAERVTQPGHGGVAEVADFLLLQTVNRHEPFFKHLIEHPALHPERLFGVCLGLAGELATFSNNNRRSEIYPEYQHDHLAQCFAPLMTSLRQSLSMVMHQNAVSIELQNRDYGVRVAIISDQTLFETARFVIAVNAQLTAEILRIRFPAQVKIGPVENIRDLVNLALPGISLDTLPVAPRQIPFHAGYSYFELEKKSEFWKKLNGSGGLAVHIAGDFPELELELWAIMN